MLRDSKETTEIRVHKDPKVTKEDKDRRVLQETMVFKAPKETTEATVYRDPKETKV